MIGYLRGKLASKSPPWLVIDVAGVGYELEAPMSTIYDLPEVGQDVRLLTHYAHREDSVSLYGFLHENERRLFRHILKVGGIGAKIALAVLSSVSVSAFAHILQTKDIAALTRIPGIGKKTAERILLELGDRIPAVSPDIQPLQGRNQPSEPRAEAAVALQQLGYKPAEAVRMVSTVAQESDDVTTIIRKALQTTLQ